MSDEFNISSEPQLMGSLHAGVVRIPPKPSAIEQAVDTYFAENPVLTGPTGPQGPRGEKGDPGSGGAAIVDVFELPTENISSEQIYRVIKGTMVYWRTRCGNWTCHCVETLPETGEIVVDDSIFEEWTWSPVTCYYNAEDGDVYGYVDGNLVSMLNLTRGWHTMSSLMLPITEWSGCGTYTFEGVITNIVDDPEDDNFRILIEYNLFWYKDRWILLNSIGREGSGVSAETFNDPINEARGDFSHAEGTEAYATGVASHVEGGLCVATGDYAHAEGLVASATGPNSHAEGENTSALGQASHAEGCLCTAEADYSHAEGTESYATGEASHAEGYMGYAMGAYSHAEGEDTYAIGMASHAEGCLCTAEGDYSHAAGVGTSAYTNQYVYGSFNISDLETHEDGFRARYVHIVGNGMNAENPSNAHTLDWYGNAWYAGSIEGTHMILKSPDGSRFKITVDDNGTLSTTKIT